MNVIDVKLQVRGVKEKGEQEDHMRQENETSSFLVVVVVILGGWCFTRRRRGSIFG